MFIMINTENNGNGDLGGAIASPVRDKKLDGTLKKMALRDVQNANLGSVDKNQESVPPAGGKSICDTIKVCGTKRLTPERPSTTQGFLSSAYNDTNENVVNARRRFELELGRGRLQNNGEKNQNRKEMNSMVFQVHEVTRRLTQAKDNDIHHVPIAISSNQTAAVVSSNDPPVSHAFGKPNHGRTVAKVSPDLSHIVDSKSAKEQLRVERFIHLQNFLKQCDGANRTEYNRTLMQLSAAELNKLAVVLERRSIQLSVEEAKEMDRGRALNVLAKPSPGNNLLESTPLLQ